MYKVLYYYLNNKYNFYSETKSHTTNNYVIKTTTVDYFKTKTNLFYQIITRYIFLVLKKTFLN